MVPSKTYQKDQRGVLTGESVAKTHGTYTWLVVYLPLLKKIRIRQLGWWHSQLNGKNKTCSKPPTRYCKTYCNINCNIYIYTGIYCNILAGDIPTPVKMCSQLGLWNSELNGKKKLLVPNHQPVCMLIYEYIYVYMHTVIKIDMGYGIYALGPWRVNGMFVIQPKKDNPGIWTTFPHFHVLYNVGPPNIMFVAL